MTAEKSDDAETNDESLSLDPWGNDQPDEPAHDEPPASSSTSAELSQVVLAEFAGRGHGVGTVNLDRLPTAAPGGFLAVLAQERDGCVIAHATTDDAELVGRLAASAAKQDPIFLSSPLATVVEAVRTQTFPSDALPSAPDKREEWIKQHASKALQLIGDAILLSHIGEGSSVTTRCVPKTALIDKGQRLCLAGEDIRQVQTWLYDNEIALIRGAPSLRSEKSADADEYVLEFSHVLTGHGGVLKFTTAANAMQWDFARDRFRPGWEVKLSAAWFREVARLWAIKWFDGLGRYNQIVREHNATLRLTITAAKMVIEFNRTADQSATEDVSFPSSLKNFKRPLSTVYFSIDLAPVLYQLAYAKCLNGITMLGNEHALVFRYESADGTYEIAVPTLAADEKHRDSAAFRLFETDDGKSQ